MEQGVWDRLLDYAEPKAWVRIHTVVLLVFSYLGAAKLKIGNN